ncbi:iron-sulfur cluster assembly accessory protein [bacterium]|jgi:iron-sulfur cluster assembly accessory protein|nr:iron-sulfur cluster assembly accessory protein [bacterium]
MSDCGNVQKVFVPTTTDTDDVLEKRIVGIEITDLAAEKILHFAKVDKKDATEYGLKISVVKDGCSGNSYQMDLAPIKDSQEAGDKIFEHNGAYAIVEKLSYLFVTGSILDYAETLLMSGFQIVNPNVKKSCSCGSSVAFK